MALSSLTSASPPTSATPSAGQALVLLAEQHLLLAVAQLARGEKPGAQRAADAPEQQRLQDTGAGANLGDELTIGAGVLVGCRHVVRHHQRVVVAFTMKVDGHLAKHGRAVRVLEVATAPLDDVADEGIVVADKIAAQSLEASPKRRAEAVERIDRRRGLTVRQAQARRGSGWPAGARPSGSRDHVARPRAERCCVGGSLRPATRSIASRGSWRQLLPIPPSTRSQPRWRMRIRSYSSIRSIWIGVAVPSSTVSARLAMLEHEAEQVVRIALLAAGARTAGAMGFVQDDAGIASVQ